MTSSSSPLLQRGLDTMLLVYSLLQGHPASTPCEQFLRSQTGWFTSTLILFEARAVLTKVYGVDPALTTQKLTQFAAGPVILLDLTPASALSALQLADSYGLDLTDAVLLHLTRQHGASCLATDDQRLAQACTQFGILPQSPLDAALRQQIAAWEAANLAPKGLARVLRRVHQWLNQTHFQAAVDFWSQTGGGSHLP
ncbi:MAG TPA: PIN domain-containing protein [Gemmataceae bacterium]|nr:PIN domain-containing protein [Gemmataceae bacterium]